MTKRCPWTGLAFNPRVKGKPQVFASPAARLAAHSAARRYTMALIRDGYLTWDALKAWDQQPEASPLTCTLPPMREAS